jgi:hypothetical protein
LRENIDKTILEIIATQAQQRPAALSSGVLRPRPPATLPATVGAAAQLIVLAAPSPILRRSLGENGRCGNTPGAPPGLRPGAACHAIRP